MCLAGVHSCVNEPHVARLLRTPCTTALQALPAHQDSATAHNPGLRACAERYVNTLTRDWLPARKAVLPPTLHMHGTLRASRQHSIHWPRGPR